MDTLIGLLIFGVGCLLGGILTWLVFKTKLRAEFERGTQTSAHQHALIQQTLEHKEQQIAETQKNLAELVVELQNTRDSLHREMESRAKIEERASRIPELEQQCLLVQQKYEHLNQEKSALHARLAQTETMLEEERKASAEKLAVWDDARKQLMDAFKVLSADSLASNNQQFLTLARETLAKFQESAQGDLKNRQQAIENLVKPVQKNVEDFGAQVRQLEKSREGAYQGLLAHLQSLQESQKHLQKETHQLVQSLRTTSVRGRWGEIQLKRVVELAGMLQHCDFHEQADQTSSDGKRLRPDLVVKLPGNKLVVVDAKTPMTAYLEAHQTQDESERHRLLKTHADHVYNHVKQLGEKAYWQQFDPTPEFVVLFLPGENFYSAALQYRPALIEEGVEKRIVLATPTTLIALLRAVSYGWSQENISQNAQQICVLGKQLYDSLNVLTKHWQNMGKALHSTIDHYNKSIGSLESNVLVKARRFADLQSVSQALPDLNPVDQQPREIQAKELMIEQYVEEERTELNP